MVSQESTVNNTYQCLIAMSVQHVLVITFPYLFVNMYIITISLRLLMLYILEIPQATRNIQMKDVQMCYSLYITL